MILLPAAAVRADERPRIDEITRLAQHRLDPRHPGAGRWVRGGEPGAPTDRTAPAAESDDGAQGVGERPAVAHANRPPVAFDRT